GGSTSAAPPYNLGINSAGRGAKADRLPPEEYAQLAVRWAKAFFDLLTDDGSLWLLIDHPHAYEHEAAIRAAGFTIRSYVTWYETFGVCNSAGSNFSRTSRRLFYAVKNRRNFVWHKEAAMVTSARQTEYQDARANPEGKIDDDVWRIPRVCGTFGERLPEFPCQLPVQLLLRIVGLSSDPGDVILDPFSGSATCGEAALKLGRKFVGIEREPRYVELSRLRLRDPKPVTP